VPGTAARIGRDALEQRLADALGRASLLVVAGAGFGKTTALEAAVQRSGLTGAWVRCAEGDDAGTLMTRILAALERAMPGAVDVLGEGLVVPGQRVDPRALAAQVSGGLAELLVEPLVLVLDDAEHVRASPAACALVAELLAADGAIRVAVATRTELPVGAARLEAAGRLTVIGAADLVLDARECAELLHARRGSEPQPDEVDAVLEATEGWALGVAAAAIAGGAALDGRALAADGRAFAFLAEEVLDRLPGELTGRLEDSALPAELDALTLGALELPDGFVAEVRERGLFLGTAGAAPGAVRYHPLFRALLLRRGEQRGEPARRAALHARLAAALQEAGRPADAIEHWFAADEAAEAAGAIAAAGSPPGAHDRGLGALDLGRRLAEQPAAREQVRAPRAHEADHEAAERRAADLGLDGAAVPHRRRRAVHRPHDQARGRDLAAVLRLAGRRPDHLLRVRADALQAAAGRHDAAPGARGRPRVGSPPVRADCGLEAPGVIRTAVRDPSNTV
jgi:LuxR family maltose regulon positive regulatory protein